MKPTTTDDVFDLIDAHHTSAALGAAMELGLFWVLAEQPRTSAAIAEALDIPLNRCESWLRLLSHAGLLQGETEGYAPSPVARTAILDAYSQETWAFLAADARDRFPAVQNLTRDIHHPGSVWRAQGLESPNWLSQVVENPDYARRFTRTLYEIHLRLADAVAGMLDMDGVGRLLDLGGGSGVVSLALLRRHPQLQAVVVDMPNVCAAGREIAQENGLADRITYLPADFAKDDLPSGFDLALQCDVGAHDEEILTKLWSTLDPGGRLAMVDQYCTSPGVVPPTWVFWAFQSTLANPHSSLRTLAETRDQLTQMGFRILSERSVPPSDIVRWSADWTLIEISR